MPSGRQKSGRRALLRSLAGYAGRLGQLQQCQYHTIMPHVGAHDVRSQAMTHQRVVVHSDGEEGEGRPHARRPAAPARPYTTTGSGIPTGSGMIPSKSPGPCTRLGGARRTAQAFRPRTRLFNLKSTRDFLRVGVFRLFALFLGAARTSYLFRLHGCTSRQPKLPNTKRSASHAAAWEGGHNSS